MPITATKRGLRPILTEIAEPFVGPLRRTAERDLERAPDLVVELIAKQQDRHGSTPCAHPVAEHEPDPFRVAARAGVELRGRDPERRHVPPAVGRAPDGRGRPRAPKPTVQQHGGDPERGDARADAGRGQSGGRGGMRREPAGEEPARRSRLENERRARGR